MKRLRLSARQRNHFDWLMQVGYTTLRLFARNGLQNHAAATAFYFMLSATPLMFILSYGLGSLHRFATDSSFVSLLLASVHGTLRIDFLHETGFIPHEARFAAGSVSLVTLLIASRGLLRAIQSAFVVIFPSDTRRRIVVSTALPLLILPLAFALVFLSALAKVALNTLAELDLLGALTSHLLELLSVLIGFVTVWGLIFTAYWRMPLRPPSVRGAAIVAALASVSLFFLAALFGRLFRVENYQAIYGALGGVVFVLIGALAAWIIFYFWAQCLYALSKVDVVALERLFLGASQTGANRLETYVFARSNRLLEKYGRTYAAGEILIREGEDGKEAYFLYSGRVKLHHMVQGRDISLGELAEGELFGEMAYLLGEKRTATVIAATDVVALVLPPRILEELMQHSAPLSRRIIGTLCQRLQRMNENLFVAEPAATSPRSTRDAAA